MSLVHERNLVLCDRRIAVAGHVDEGQAAADIEEIEFLRPPGRVRGPGERRASGQRVDEARLADI